MKKIILSLIVFAISNAFTQTESLQWVKSYELSNSRAKSICTDQDGNIYSLIWFIDSVDADPGPGRKMESSYKEGMLVCKMDQKGNYIWSQVFKGDFPFEGGSVSLDGQGNVYVGYRYTDSFFYTINNNLVKENGFGSNDFFACKLNNDGKLMWLKTFGSANLDFLVSSIADQEGNFYMTGNYRGSMDFDPGPGTKILTPGGATELFLLKLKSNGDFDWVMNFPGSVNTTTFSIDLDEEENLVIGGQFTGTCNFNPFGTAVSRTVYGNYDFFAARYTPNGHLIRVINGGGSGADYATTTKFSNKYGFLILGSFQGTAVFDSNNAAMNMSSVTAASRFIAKYDSTGVCAWRLQTPQLVQYYYYDRFLDFDNEGNIITAGYYSDSIDTDFGTDAVFKFSKGSHDIYLIKMNGNGKLVWSQTFGSMLSDRFIGLCVNKYNQYYFVGDHNDSCLFEFGDDSSMVYHGRSGMHAFILKIGEPDPVNTQNITVDDIKVFPVPASNFIHIEGMEGMAVLSIVDLQGRILLNQELEDTDMDLNIDGLDSGVYTLLLDFGNQRFVKKLLIAH